MGRIFCSVSSMVEGGTAPSKHYDFATLTKMAKALDSK